MSSVRIRQNLIIFIRAIQQSREGGLMQLVWLIVKGKHFPTQIDYLFHSASGWKMGWENIMFSDGRKAIVSPVY